MRGLSSFRAEHRIVLSAVDAAYAVKQEGVTIDDVMLLLTDDEVERLDKTYAADPQTSVKRILQFLLRTGVLVHAERGNGVVPAADTPETRPSNRQVVRRLVEECFAREYRRPLRSGDIKEYANAVDYAQHLTWADVQSALASLLKTGDIQDLGRQPGGGHRGCRLFAPLGSPVCTDDADSTWLSHLYRVFQQVWQARVSEATAENRRPRPPSTGDIREAVRASGAFLDRLEDPQLLINGVRQLAARRQPLLRKVRRPGQRNLLWAPVDVADEVLDLGSSFASDTERVVEAVRRAEASFGRPVELAEVKDVIDRDAALSPGGASSIFQILSDISKTTIDAGRGTRARRRRQKVHALGSVGGRALYTAGDPAEGARYATAERLRLEWYDLNVYTALSEIAGCAFNSVKVGRAMELEVAILDLHTRAEELGAEGPRALHSALEVLREAARAVQELQPLKTSNHSLPGELHQTVTGYTPAELTRLLEPHYHAASNAEAAHDIVPNLARAIWRIPNEAHTRRFDTDDSKAAEYLFEKTDALTYLARRWGGREAIMQGNLALHMLGRLRDHRFVLPLLASSDVEARLTGIACLAFLQPDCAQGVLAGLAEKDRERGVRESARWAARFVAACGTHAFAAALAD